MVLSLHLKWDHFLNYCVKCILLWGDHRRTGGGTVTDVAVSHRLQ